MTEQSTHVDGLRIRYLDAGQGQPVVLLHGASLGSSADVFERNFAPLVEAGLRPIAMDRPGYGLSDGPGDRTPAGHRRFLLGFMDALGLDSALVVGHSQQGGVTAQVALDHPDRIPRAVILGGGGVLPPSPEGDEPDAEGQQLTSEPTLEQVRDILKANLYNHDLITPDALALRHRMSLGSAFQFYTQRSAGRPAGGASPGGATATEPVWKRVGMNPEQFLLIFGRQDKPTTEQRCELARQQFPKLRLVLLDHCAHLAQWDQADELVRQTIAFARAGAVAV